MNIAVLTTLQKIGLGALAALLFTATILGGVWLIYSKGEQSAENAAKARHQEELRLHAQMVGRALDSLQTELTDKLDQTYGDLNVRLNDINKAENTVIKPTLIKEIQNDSRLSDPDFVLTDGVRDAINAARAQSACPERATGGDCGTVSRARSDQ